MLRSLIFILALPGAAFAQTQSLPPIRITDTVVVSGRDAKKVADAVNELRQSRDPLVGDTVADHIVALTRAMASSGRVNEIGPLTGDEQDTIDLRAMLEKYSYPGGPINIRPRNADSTPGPRKFQLTEAAFIAMCADMGSSPLLQQKVIQENKMIIVARMIADLNEQHAELITDRAVLEGVLAGFKEQDLKGVITERVQGIADALAINSDQNAPYELVPKGREEQFRQLTTMGKDVFEVVARPRIRSVNVAYESKIYATTEDHFVWFFLRFLLSEDNAIGPATHAKRVQLGSDLLDYLTDQLQSRVIESALASLEAAPAPGQTAYAFADFYAIGPGLAGLKNAPGLSQQASVRGPNFRTLVVSAKQMRDLPELRQWLTRELSKR